MAEWESRSNQRSSREFSSLAKRKTFLEGTYSPLQSELGMLSPTSQGASFDTAGRLETFLEGTSSSLQSTCSEALRELEMESNQSTLYSAEECPICFESYDESDESKIFLPCCHSFHECCALPWISRKMTCPTCRHPTHGREVDLETW